MLHYIVMLTFDLLTLKGSGEFFVMRSNRPPTLSMVANIWLLLAVRSSYGPLCMRSIMSHCRLLW